MEGRFSVKFCDILEIASSAFYCIISRISHDEIPRVIKVTFILWMWPMSLERLWIFLETIPVFSRIPVAVYKPRSSVTYHPTYNKCNKTDKIVPIKTGDWIRDEPTPEEEITRLQNTGNKTGSSRIHQRSNSNITNFFEFIRKSNKHVWIISNFFESREFHKNKSEFFGIFSNFHKFV